MKKRSTYRPRQATAPMLVNRGLMDDKLSLVEKMIVEALRGVIAFHQIAEARHGITADVDGLIRFANKLHSGAPIFEQDLALVRANIDTCKRQALGLLLDEATDIIQTIRIGMELDKLKPAPAAHSERSAQADGKTAPGAGTHRTTNYPEKT